MACEETRYSYLVEWRDPRTDVVWKYELYVFPDTKEVEMLDLRNRKLFLKRCTPEGLALVPELLRPGSRVNILSRQLHILDYADSYTRLQLQHRQERTLAMIKPDAVEHFSKVVQMILDEGFIIGEVRLCQLLRDEAEGFYLVHKGKDFFPRLVEFMTSGRVVAIELLAPGAVEKWRNLLGPTDSNFARIQSPKSIRAHFGTDKTYNACHGSDSAQNAELECNFFFTKQISAQFQIVCAQTCHFTTSSANNLLEIYKGVIPLSEYNSMIQDLCSGNTLALEVRNLEESKEEPCVEALRNLCGPSDPVIALAVRPNSIRARFGLNKIQNAVHCTDLEEDSFEEIRKVFGGR